MKQENIFISDYTELEPKFQDRCNEYFKTELYPILTPNASETSSALSPIP